MALLTLQLKLAGQVLEVEVQVIGEQWWLLAQLWPSGQSVFIVQPGTHPMPDGHEQGTCSQTDGVAASTAQSVSPVHGC